MRIHPQPWLNALRGRADQLLKISEKLRPYSCNSQRISQSSLTYWKHYSLCVDISPVLSLLEHLSPEMSNFPKLLDLHIMRRKLPKGFFILFGNLKLKGLSIGILMRSGIEVTIKKK